MGPLARERMEMTLHLLTSVISPANTYDSEYINKSKQKRGPQTDIGHQISAMMLRFEQLLGITADCKCCSGKYKEKVASFRVNETIAENPEFNHIENQAGNT
jgi:hypothetical protein